MKTTANSNDVLFDTVCAQLPCDGAEYDAVGLPLPVRRERRVAMRTLSRPICGVYLFRVELGGTLHRGVA